MLMCKLFCLADFVVGSYYTGQGTCKSATRGEEQVSSNRPGQVFSPLLASRLATTLQPHADC